MSKMMIKTCYVKRTKMKDKMQNLSLFDGRNQYDPEYIKNSGFEYKGIGR